MRDYIRMLAQCKQVRGRGRARGLGLGLGLGLVTLALTLTLTLTLPTPTIMPPLMPMSALTTPSAASMISAFVMTWHARSQRGVAAWGCSVGLQRGTRGAAPCSAQGCSPAAAKVGARAWLGLGLA